MSQVVWTRKDASDEAVAVPDPAPIPAPPETVDELIAQGDGFTLASFTTDDAWHLGHLLHARLVPVTRATGKAAAISVSLANSSQVVFQCVTGPGTAPDNAVWIARKRATVLRFGCSTWLMHCKFGGDERAFAAKYGLSPDQAAEYAIHGGAVPIRVRGVEGVVAVVVVSGLKQHEDHGVVVSVIRQNWQRAG